MVERNFVHRAPTIRKSGKISGKLSWSASMKRFDGDDFQIITSRMRYTQIKFTGQHQNFIFSEIKFSGPSHGLRKIDLFRLRAHCVRRQLRIQGRFWRRWKPLKTYVSIFAMKTDKCHLLFFFMIILDATFPRFIKISENFRDLFSSQLDTFTNR